MFRKIAVFFLILFSVVFGVMPSEACAHELIPKALTEYVKNNPNATPEEIKAFANNQNPEFAQNFRDGEAILEMVRQQKTSLFDNMFDFFKLGIHHILSGFDHILFVLSLLLVFISWKDVLKLTGTFTVAHSITLVLAGTGLLVLSPRIVEPIIALSIAYVAITSVFFKGSTFVGENKGKIAAVFFFGLFHGLGFAGLLTEINIPTDKFISSLIAFNLGIEAGQLFIVALAFPFIYFFSKKAWYPLAVKTSAGFISAIALYWVVERVFFI